jgi:hypothetical protein
MDEDIVVPLAFFATIIVMSIVIPIVRATVRRWDRQSLPPQIPAETTQRLERIEQAVDAIAIEVERIAESQRFVAKLMAERPAERVPLRAGEEREQQPLRGQG